MGVDLVTSVFIPDKASLNNILPLLKLPSVPNGFSILIVSDDPLLATSTSMFVDFLIFLVLLLVG